MLVPQWTSTVLLQTSTANLDTRIVAFVDSAIDTNTDADGDAYGSTNNGQSDQDLDQQALLGRQAGEPATAPALRFCHA